MFFERSSDFFKIHYQIWRILGIIPTKNYRILYFIWSFIFNFGVTFFYPLHLMMGLFKVRAKDELFKNLAINFADSVCTIKFIIVWHNLNNIRIVEALFTTLDERIETKEEKISFRKLGTICQNIFYCVGATYTCALVSSELSTFFGSEKHLLYPGWLPIDWKKSSTNYWIANMYQFFGAAMQILTNYGGDTYAAISLAVLSGHIRLLGIRLSNLGRDPSKTQEYNNKELKKCIKDHKLLIELYDILRNVLSMGMFWQIIGTGFNLCCVVIYLVFYANNIFSKMYYGVLILAMPLQIFPTCYLGSTFEEEFNELPYAAFSGNWMDQDAEFKQNMLIFAHRALQPAPLMCMGFFRIHLDTFFIALRSAYSLFAVVLQAK